MHTCTLKTHRPCAPPPPAGRERVAVSSLMAAGHVHHHLVTLQKRSRVGLLLESAEAREVHHFCLLLGYGVDAVCPYLAFDTLGALREDGHIPADLADDALADNYIKVGGRPRRGGMGRACGF